MSTYKHENLDLQIIMYKVLLNYGFISLILLRRTLGSLAIKILCWLLHRIGFIVVQLAWLRQLLRMIFLYTLLPVREVVNIFPAHHFLNNDVLFRKLSFIVLLFFISNLARCPIFLSISRILISFALQWVLLRLIELTFLSIVELTLFTLLLRP